jgi:hypothetical protein
MKVAGATQIGVVEQRGGMVILGAMFAREQRGDALAIEDTQLDGPCRDGLNACGVEAAIGAQNPQASPEPLFRMRSAGERGYNQSLGVWPDLPGPTAEPFRRPLGVAPVRTGHVLGVRAVLAADIATLVDGDALTAMEYLDRARRDAKLDLGADEGVRNRVEKVVDLDVIIEIDACARPLRELPLLGGQGAEHVALDLLEQLAPAQPEIAHRPFVHAARMTSAMASLHSASEKNVSARNRPRM